MAQQSNIDCLRLTQRWKNVFSKRKLIFAALLLILFLCVWILGGLPDKNAAAHDGFLQAALHPTLTDQNQSLPEDATPFYTRIIRELGTTIRYAIIAMSMAVPAGILLGFLASHAWLPNYKSSGNSGRFLRFFILPLHLIIRLFITLMRSIHELIWAIFFLAAIGDEPITACVALALPFAGTLAKVFSEIIDELPKQAAEQALSSGASSLQSFFTTLIPQAFPDMATYTLYRFECALRSSAVLGFIGVETIGLSIKKSFENNFYNELWTQLYLLIAVIMLIDVLGAALRKKLHNIPERKRTPKPDTKNYLYRLKKTAPHWKFPRIILIITILLTTLSWFPNLCNIKADALLNQSSQLDRSERVSRFLKKITPSPVRESQNWEEAIPWAKQLWQDAGKEALINTICIATAAITLAGLTAWLLIPWANRAFTHSKPLGLFNGKPSWRSKILWKFCGFGTRFFFLISRAIPEYIIAYLLIGLLGISAWPLVLALAIHNLGILGRLWGEVLENQPTSRAETILTTGASRTQCYLQSYLPESLNRFLLYLFYRWETCVREATILGMLGVISLGYHIQIARNFSRAYDEMFFYVLLGALIIFIGDIISQLLRKSMIQS